MLMVAQLQSPSVDLTSTTGMTLSSGGALAIDTDGVDAVNFGNYFAAKNIIVMTATDVDVNPGIELDLVMPVKRLIQ